MHFSFKKLTNHVLMISTSMLACQAYAWDFTPDSSRIVSDPSYLPMKGQVYGSTDFSYGRSTGETSFTPDIPIIPLSPIFNSGTINGRNNMHTQTISQQLSYGVTDDITLGFAETYEWEKITAHSINAYSAGLSDNFTNEVAGYSHGFIDPAITGTWRAFDQKNRLVNWDIFGSYLPDWINDHSPSYTHDGSAAFGGQQAMLGTAVSYKTRDFTVYGSGTATFLSGSDYLDFMQVDHNDAHWRYSINLDTQTRLTNLISINAGVAETITPNVIGVTYVEGFNMPYNYSAVSTTDLNAALNYQLIPNRLVAGLTYDYRIYSDSHAEYNGSFPTYYKNENENIIGVKLQYTFN